MRRALLMLIPAVLVAQRSALPPAEAFDRDLKRSRLGTWLVLEDEGAAWGATFRTVLDDEALIELNLPLRVVSGGKKPDALAAILRDRFGWPKGAHWALADGNGRLLMEGATAPTAAGLASAVEQAGLRSRTQELETFLQQHPDHLEAQLALLMERVAVANRRTRKALAVMPEKPTGDPSEEPEPPRHLEPEKDLLIWSPITQPLSRLFQGPWREAGSEPGVVLSLSLAEHSPAMVALLTRHRVDIEEALRHRPNAPELWRLWLVASRKCGGWALAPLLQSLQPLPGTPPGEWPPVMALNEFVKDARARRDWVAIREVLEARWADLRLGESRWGGGENLWAIVISPLVEALISLGDISAADQLVNEVCALDGWTGLPGRARNLATRMNRPDLAAAWGALTTKGR